MTPGSTRAAAVAFMLMAIASGAAAQERAFDSVIAASHKVPGAIWSLGKTLVDNAVRKSA